MESLLEARELGRRPEGDPGGAWLLQDVSLELYAGESVVLGGPSGSGKTVLLRSLCGLDPVQAGEVRFDGRPIASWPMPEYRSRVVYLHQRPVLFEGSVEENLRRVYGLRAHRSRRFEPERVAGWLARLGRDAGFLGRRSAELSGGEQEIVALLRALQLDPQVILLDEATASLDPAGVAAVEALIAGWRAGEARRACIWTSHDPAQAQRLADRVLTLRDGRIARGRAPAALASEEGASR